MKQDKGRVRGEEEEVRVKVDFFKTISQKEVKQVVGAGLGGVFERVGGHGGSER